MAAEHLFDAILYSGKAWDVARAEGLYVYFHDDGGGYCVTDSGAHPLSIFPKRYASSDAACRAIFAYLLNR